jgi:hypothetical protein
MIRSGDRWGRFRRSKSVKQRVYCPVHLCLQHCCTYARTIQIKSFYLAAVDFDPFDPAEFVAVFLGELT